MSNKELVTSQDLISIIFDYVSKSSGLGWASKGDLDYTIIQKSDSKSVQIKKSELSDVLVRKDPEGREFVQINFVTGKKILLTDQLIGFKPQPFSDLDVSKLPRVVTTLDLLSVFEAIEESASTAEEKAEDTDMLKKVFNSILLGGEDIGLDLGVERTWLKRLAAVKIKTSA
ncbi:MAG: hypothetical protein IT289_05280 [Oligoflexia bacterium]|nr:hypothetical protein [Oligoflexia bacterium]